jgi:hypothetical protein
MKIVLTTHHLCIGKTKTHFGKGGALLLGWLPAPNKQKCSNVESKGNGLEGI